MRSNKKTSSMFRTAFKIFAVILTFILITNVFYGTAFAQITGTVSQTITPPDTAVKQVVVNDGISPKAGSALKIILWALLGAVLIAGGVLLVRFAILKRKS